MPFYDQIHQKRALDASTSPSKPASSRTSSTSSSRSTLTAPSTPPTTRPPSPTRRKSSSANSWDTSLHPSTSSYYPSDPNGDWMTEVHHTIIHPGTAASAIQESLTWPNVRDKVANAAMSASDHLQQSVNRALQGKDVPAMHDKLLSYVPTLSVPSMASLSRGIDCLSDGVQEVLAKRCDGNEKLVDKEVIGDEFAFARYMGQKAKRALVKQGICREWQVMATRENLGWLGKLDDAFLQLFVEENDACGEKELFEMEPIWSGDVENEEWRLELDTGLLEVIVMKDSEESQEKRICLKVEFALPESAGSVRIRDVEQVTVDDDDWMAVELKSRSFAKVLIMNRA